MSAASTHRRSTVADSGEVHELTADSLNDLCPPDSSILCAITFLSKNQLGIRWNRRRMHISHNWHTFLIYHIPGDGKIVAMLKSLNIKFSNDRFLFVVADNEKQQLFKAPACFRIYATKMNAFSLAVYDPSQNALLEGIEDTTPQLIVWNSKKGRVVTHEVFFFSKLRTRSWVILQYLSPRDPSPQRPCRSLWMPL